MIDICLLGTGGTMPMPNRALTALLVRHDGHSLLVDCGEGTQMRIREKKWSMKSIDALLFTHFHADHISGLPGFLLSVGKDGRTDDLVIIGPPGISHVVNRLRVIVPDLPYSIIITEIKEKEAVFNVCGLRVNAFRAEHSVECFGYSVFDERLPKFDAERASKLDLPKMYWGKLQKGENVEYEGKLYTPDMVQGESRRGIRLTYITDSRPTDNMIKNAENSDLLICEGMYGDDKRDMAVQKLHMTFGEAAEIAKKANVKELWLTHFSTSLEKPEAYLEETKKIFGNTVIPENLMSREIRFE